MDFERRFGTEEQCRAYLVQLRWPEGFRCPRCGHATAWPRKGRALLVCAACHHDASVTAGTIFHRSRQPLRVWFSAIWWLTAQKTGGSAAGLQHALGWGSYETAWLMLHKLRRAMVRPGREPLTGTVEVDDTLLGGVERRVVGRETLKKAKLVAAVEVPKGRLGRIRLQHVRDFSAESLLPFVRANVVPRSRVITDGWWPYTSLITTGYRHIRRLPKGPRDRLLPHVHTVISLLKRWLLGTQQGRVDAKHLQSYLDEFAFRFNRRKSLHRGQLFYRVLQHAVTLPSTPYQAVVQGRA